jgi:hypothetical protein
VLELSSYQIDLTQSLDCDVAVLLNITPDHLDRYESFEAYAASKLRLFEMQRGDHIGAPAKAGVHAGKAVVGTDAEALRATGLLPSQEHWPALQGPHNAECCSGDSGLSLAWAERGDNRRSPPYLSRPAAPHGAVGREGRRRSSTTARRPTRPRPRRRSQRLRASAGFAAGRPRPTASTNARRTSAMSAPPTRSARRRSCSRSC